jgi:hypothetical protein
VECKPGLGRPSASKREEGRVQARERRAECKQEQWRWIERAVITLQLGVQVLPCASMCRVCVCVRAQGDCMGHCCFGFLAYLNNEEREKGGKVRSGAFL